MTINDLKKKTATKVIEEADKVIVRYHSTDIVTIYKDKVVLNHGGWMTATTKRRMNEVSKVFNLGFGVYQDKGIWYINMPNGSLPQFDISPYTINY